LTSENNLDERDRRLHFSNLKHFYGIKIVDVKGLIEKGGSILLIRPCDTEKLYPIVRNVSCRGISNEVYFKMPSFRSPTQEVKLLVASHEEL
jgi:hypothetical protein